MAVAGNQMKGVARPLAGAMDSAECLSEEVFARYLKSLDHLVEADAEVPQRVAEEVEKLVAQGNWLPEDCCEPGDECYRRHVLYGDPAGRFTVMAVVWRPGQGTPLHGHTAWGAVGVYRGNPSVATYRYVEGEAPVATGEYHCKPGDVCHVTPGTAEPHRVFNASDDLAITIHTYGRDLTLDPSGINILLEDA